MLQKSQKGKKNNMANKSKKIRLLTAVLTAVMLISTVMTVTLSANGTTYYGSSPSISDVTGSIDVGTENLLNQSVMYKLPDTVEVDDEISVIIKSQSSTLLDAYDKSGSKLSFTEYVLTTDADRVRENILAETAALQNLLAGIEYTVGQSYNGVISGFEIII